MHSHPCIHTCSSSAPWEAGGGEGGAGSGGEGGGEAQAAPSPVPAAYTLVASPLTAKPAGSRPHLWGVVQAGGRIHE